MRKIASQKYPQRFLDMFRTFMFLDNDLLSNDYNSSNYLKNILSIIPKSERDDLLKEVTGKSVEEVKQMLKTGLLSRTVWENSVKESLYSFGFQNFES